MRVNRCAPHERSKIVGDVPKRPSSAQKFVRETVNLHGPTDAAAGIEVLVKYANRRKIPVDFKGCNVDDSVAAGRGQARGFSVKENDAGTHCKYRK